MDKTTIPGIAFGIGMILLGQKLEGGHAGSLLQLTAFLIVVGVMPCSALYASSLARRRSVSAMARSIDPVMRSA